MGVGMINTVLFMAVIFCGVWNIVPRRLRRLKKEKQASWCANFHQGRGVFVWFFFNFPCVFILLAVEERLSIKKCFAHCGKQTCVAPGRSLTCLCLGRSLELTESAVRKSHHPHTASVKTSVRAEIDTPPPPPPPHPAVIHLSSFCFPVSFHLQPPPPDFPLIVVAH